MDKKENIEVLLKMKMLNEKSIKIYHPDIYEEIINYNKNYIFHKKEKFIAKIFNYINNQKSGECIVCGNPTLFKRKINGYKLYCSQQCYDKDDKKIISEKIKNIWNEKYGGHPSSNGKVKEKKKNTIENYTNEKKKEIKSKYKETCINKYGVDNPLKNKEIINKIKNTVGNKKSYLLEITKNKIKVTNILRHGFTVASKNKLISEKVKIKNGNKTEEEKKEILEKTKKSIKKYIELNIKC